MPFAYIILAAILNLEAVLSQTVYVTVGEGVEGFELFHRRMK
jgi:hypothetical protein